MYIYFGANSRDQTGAGRQVLIVGAVIALVAQFLTLASGLKRITSQRQEPALLILLNTELALTLTNLVFMLGVQATGDTSQCEMVAVSLHYLHLVVCCWLFATSLHLYRRLTLDNYRPTVWLYALAAWTAPALLVYVCTKLNRDGYESHDYCWMSVEKGMLFSFMIPVSVLMLGNTVLAVLGLRLASHWKEESVERKWVRVSATLLPLFAVVWFLGVVALENSASLVFPLLFLASNGFLNWFVFICWLPTDISAWHESEEDFDEEEEELFEEHHQQHQQQVMQAQKQEVYVCGRRHHYDLQMDPICTISS
ncbi:hypothetical protein AAG570_002063 [Ranatra chinensis]|uniref:G-protein coupled receptors family 2 profile 2 domain-containing protein n=1 Tax=Ranatra chinensis TaxID=642074 RepID=A0ABD0YAC7_9HEMI